jgi:MATE family multidrug resistance protein
MLLHIFWSNTFILHWNLGLSGAALAANLTYFLNFLIIDFIHLYHKAFSQTRANLKESFIFSNWSDYLRIGLPGACMLCFEWWAFELLAIFSGYISISSLAAEVVLINIVAFLFMIPLGISIAASALTGACIGQGSIQLS